MPKRTYMLAAADKKVVISLICLESVNVILVVYYYLHCSSGPNPRMTAARGKKCRGRVEKWRQILLYLIFFWGGEGRGRKKGKGREEVA